MASAKALQKEYDKYLLTAKKYDLDGDLRRAKAYFQRALQLVPKFKKSKTNEKNAEKLKKKIAKYVQKIMEEDIQKQMSGFGVSRPSSSQTSEENDENATQANVSKKDGEGKSKGLKDVPSSEWSIPDENGNSAYLPEGYSITKTLYDTLFEHQRKGVSCPSAPPSAFSPTTPTSVPRCMSTITPKAATPRTTCVKDGGTI